MKPHRAWQLSRPCRRINWFAVFVVALIGLALFSIQAVVRGDFDFHGQIQGGKK